MIIEIGPWVFEPLRCMVAGPTGFHALRRRDGDVLHVLAQRAPAIVSIPAIKDGAFGRTHVVDEAVTNAIVRLRVLFGDDAAHPEVVARADGGYRLLRPVRFVPVKRDKECPYRPLDANDVEPPSVALLRPAWLSGAWFSAQSRTVNLAEAVLNDVMDVARPNPVLAMVGAHLWERRSSDGAIAPHSYEDAEGAAGIWAGYGEGIVSRLPAASQSMFPAIVLALSHAEGPWLPPASLPPSAQGALDALVAGRWLVDDGQGCLQPRFALAMRKWHRAALVLAVHSRRLEEWDLLARASRLWAENGRASGFTLGSGPLQLLRGLENVAGDALSSVEREFLDSSRTTLEAGHDAQVLAMEMLRLADPAVSPDRHREARAALDAAYERLRSSLVLDAALEDLALEAARAYMNLGVHDRALELTHRVVEARLSSPSDGMGQVARARLVLGRVHYNRGDMESAIAAYELALLWFERQEGASQDLAQALHDLAEAIAATGRYEEAQAMNRRALQLRRDLFGPCHVKVADSLNNLAGNLRMVGASSEAENCYRSALDVARRTYGVEHPEVATISSNLGILLGETGRVDEALALEATALKIRRRVFGKSHPATASSLNNHATLLNRLGDPRAEEEWRACGVILDRLYGHSHPSVASVRNNLGCLLKAKSLWNEAETEFRLAADGLAIGAFKKHPARGIALTNLARMLSELGRLDEADSAVTTALENLDQVLSPAHPRVVDAKQLCADLQSRRRSRQ